MVKIVPESEFQEDFEIEENASKTYKINIEDNTIEGFCDELEAIKQAIYCILNTERFDYLIYSWDYGSEFKHLIGEQSTYVIPELERVIKEALIQDDRIEDITEFEFIQEKNKIITRFKVITVLGNIEAEKEVKV